jgi:K+-transporting ATPase ATPase B chain
MEETVSTDLRSGDRVEIVAGEVVPSDGEIVEGVASIDESAITGESAPVIREAGGDRSGVTGGTRVLSDRIVVQITANPGSSFLDRMIALVEGAIRQRTPNEIALSLVLAAFTLIFLIVTATLWPMALYTEQYMSALKGTPVHSLGTDVPTLVALLVCLIPTTIGALLAAIGIAGMDRALRANIIAKSGKAVEVAGDVDTLLLDKTGTITVGNRRATQFIPFGEFTAAEVGGLAALASGADETPEGKSIVDLFHNFGNGPDGAERRSKIAAAMAGGELAVPAGARFIPFTAQTRMSGIDLPDGRQIRKGSPDAILRHIKAQKGTPPAAVEGAVAAVAGKGATPLLVSEGARIAGLVVLEDILKPGIAERFERLRRMGLRTVMVTGDNPLTAKAIAEQAGVDDYIAEATPEAKLAYIRKEQAAGKLVAMMGDGTNDAPALAQADVGVAMNSGTQAAKEAGNMVDLDSDPTKLIEVVEIGKQLLMTRGSLTTFSIANDVAKYFAIVPAMFAGTAKDPMLPWLKAVDIMNLHSATSAILSAVIFNAIIIPLLIPIALKGVKYRPIGADALLRRNLFIWGLGGIILPFVGIKLIDMVLVAVHLV